MTVPKWGEQLSRDYAKQKQAPKIPLNIIRHPLTLVPPMVPIKDQEYEREGDDPVATVPEFAEGGMDRLRDAVLEAAEEAADSSEPEDPGIPFCMACGAILVGHEPVTDPCPDCGGDVYDPTEP